MINRGKLIVYSGPSGVGKGTVLAQVLKKRKDLCLSISATTRAPRKGDVDGVNYFFLTREEFEKRVENNQMLEYAVYNNNYYGTPYSFVTKNLNKGINVILEIEVQGALKIKEICPDAVLVFLMPPSFKELENRLRGRKTETVIEIDDRLKAALSEIAHASQYDFTVINHTVEQAAEDFLKAVDAASLVCRLNNKFFENISAEAKKRFEVYVL